MKHSMCVVAAAFVLSPNAIGQCLSFEEAVDHVLDLGDSLNTERDVVAADVDGNGTMDLVVVTPAPRLGVLLNDGSGAFTADDVIDLPGGFFFTNLRVGDLDGDGDVDLFVDGEAPVTLENDGTGAFGEPEPIELLDGFVFNASRILADMDGDGDLDIVSNGISRAIVFNDGMGNFNSMSTYDIGIAAGEPSIAAADLNGDGLMDLVGVMPQGGDAFIGIGAGLQDAKGNFTPHAFMQTLEVENGRGLALDDIDGDGDLDLAVIRFLGSVSIFSNGGEGVFGHEATHVVARSFARRIEIADLDGDGHVDIATPGHTDRPLSVLRGESDGTFEPAIMFAPEFGGALAAEDFDGDGDIDIASGRVFLRNRTEPSTSNGDINGDGLVNVEDLLILLANWG